MDLKALLAQQPDKKKELPKVEIENFGTVWIRSLNFIERIRLGFQKDYPHAAAWKICASICDQDGNRLLKDDEQWKLDSLDDKAALKILFAIETQEAIEPTVEDVKKNLSETTNLDLPVS